MASRTNPIKEAITAYKHAVARVRGKSAASRTSVSYSNGWFTVVDADGSTRRLRRRQLLFFAETMEAPLEPEATELSAKQTTLTSTRTVAPERPSALSAPNKPRQARKGFILFGLGVIAALVCMFVAQGLLPTPSRNGLLLKLSNSPLAKIDANQFSKARTPTTVELATNKPEKTIALATNANVQTNNLNYLRNPRSFEKLKRIIENKSAKTHRGAMNLTELVRDFDQTNRTLSYVQTVLVSTPDGSFTTRSSFQIPLDQIAFEKSRIDPNTGGDAQFFKLVIPTIADVPIISAKLSTTGTGAYSAQTTKNPEDVPMPEFGFSFSTLQDAAEVRALFLEIYTGTTNQTEMATDQAKISRNVIIGSTKEQVDAMLKDWSIRQSNRATPSTPMYYYGKDVELIVKFRSGKAVGVAVVDRPRVGVSPIPQNRFQELTELIGETPIARDILRDAQGIREFSVGDAD